MATTVVIIDMAVGEGGGGEETTPINKNNYITIPAITCRLKLWDQRGRGGLIW